jgi:hypothetical protein
MAKNSQRFGYTHCACRDCFEIAIGEYGKALCRECASAGCEANAQTECCSPTAYGGSYDEGNTYEVDGT